MEPNPAFWSGKLVCVTGGTGMLGYQLVEQLVALGARVRILALAAPVSHPIHSQQTVTKVFADVRDRHAVWQATAGCDIIFHTAGIVALRRSGRDQMQAVHVEGTRNILTAAAASARVVHTSSVVTLGGSRLPVVRDEEGTFDLHNLRVAYVHAKRTSEQIALEAAQSGQHVVITNPGYLVGPQDHSRSLMGRICLRFWKGRVLLAPPGGFNMVDVRDVARGHLLAAEHGQPGRQYVLGGDNLSLEQLFTLLAEVGRLRPRAIPIAPGWALGALAGASECRAQLLRREPYPSFQQVLLSQYFWFYRSERAAQELGYHFRPIAQSLTDTHDWFLARGDMGLRLLNRWWMRPARETPRAA